MTLLISIGIVAAAFAGSVALALAINKLRTKTK